MDHSIISARFEEDAITDEAVVESINFIWQQFLDKLEDNEVAELEIPYASEIAMMKIRKMMELAILDHDGVYSETEALETMTPDGEPCPSTSDPWARGTVQTKKIAADENFHVAHSSSTDAMSVSSGLTGRSSSKRSLLSSGSRRGTGRPYNMDHLDKTGKIIELDDDLDGEFANLGATGFMFDMLQKMKRKKGHGYVEKDAEKGEFDIMAEEMEKARAELNGKKFVLDRYGKPVVIGTMKGDKLPPFTTTPSLQIKAPPAEEPDTDAANVSVATHSTVNTYATQATKKSAVSANQESQQQNAKNPKNKPKHFVRVAGSRGVEESSFKPTISLSTSLSGIERVPRVNPGVTVSSSAGKKHGESLPDDPTRISKKQYFERTQARRSHTSSSYLDSSSAGSFSRTMESGLLTPAPGISNGALSQTYSGGVRGGGSGVISTGKSVDMWPDLDIMEGSRVIESEQQIADLSDDDLGIGPLDTTGIENSSPLPGKPSEAQRINIGKLKGHPENGIPRDRDVPKNQIAVGARRHLPAPAIGKISGHGLTFEKLQEKKEHFDSGSEKWYEQWRK